MVPPRSANGHDPHGSKTCFVFIMLVAIGWSGTSARVTPMIVPEGRFVVRFTLPRAGTFIYHPHLHDNRQLTSGLYGALIVVEPQHRFDETLDHVFVIGRGGPARDAPVVINGDVAPDFAWKAGARHRLRLIMSAAAASPSGPSCSIRLALRTSTATGGTTARQYTRKSGQGSVRSTTVHSSEMRVGMCATIMTPAAA
jgi:hypothetical protein